MTAATVLDLAPAAVLTRAANVIERNGHTRKEFYRADDDTPASECRVCALGAIAAACGLRPDAWSEEDEYGNLLDPAMEAAHVLSMHLGLTLNRSIIEVVGDWNDYQGAADRVVAEMRAAARQAVAP